MSGRGRGKQLTRPAWMQDPRQPPPSVSSRVYNSSPVDWVQAHAADGRPYWYSLSTGQTTWNDPKSARVDPTKPTPLPADTPKPHSSDWKQHRTEDGRIYYYNAATKQTQWNAPSDLPSSAAPDKSATASAPKPTDVTTPVGSAKKPSSPYNPLPDGWAQHKTEDGRTYFYHSATRETRWERPQATTQGTQETQHRSGVKRPATNLTPSEPPGASSQLPPEWAESRTAEGKIYYYNKVTRETSWTAPSLQSDLKRPRIAGSADLRNIVNRAREQKESTSRKPEVPRSVVRRPRCSEGKPMTDRQAESYFLRRAKTRNSTADPNAHDMVNDVDIAAQSLEPGEVGEAKFYEMLKDKGVMQKTSWLEAMSRCAADHRYFLVEPYGRRKHAWMKFTQKMAKARRREDILRRRRVTEEFQQLLSTTFADEPYNVLSLNHCSPESIRSLEADARYKAVDGRERPVLVKSFFSARARRGAIEHEKHRKDALETIRKALDSHIHPSLLPPKEKLASGVQKEFSNPASVIQPEVAEGTTAKSPDRVREENMTMYFDEHTSTHELERFIQNLPQSSRIDKDDVSGIVRSWKRHIHSAVRERKARERETKRAQQREYRAAFRNGVESLMLSGQLPVHPRWKDVCELIAKEDFARTEAELDARPVDLFEDGVRLFEERVQSQREEFKRLLKDEGIQITDETTIEELQKTEGMASFLKHLEIPIATALLLDRQRKESKRRQKEKDRCLAEFEDLVRRSDIPIETSFETASERWKELPLYFELQKLVGEDSIRKTYNEFMTWRREKEEKRMKRKYEQNPGIPYNMTGIPAVETVKRPRVSMGNHEAAHFNQAQQQEEENGWAAAVSAKPINDSDKMEERERRKREILEGLNNSQPQALGANGGQSM